MTKIILVAFPVSALGCKLAVKLKLMALRCFNHGDKLGAHRWAHYKLGAVAFWPLQSAWGPRGRPPCEIPDTHTHWSIKGCSDKNICQSNSDKSKLNNLQGSVWPVYTFSCLTGPVRSQAASLVHICVQYTLPELRLWYSVLLFCIHSAQPAAADD